MESNARPSDRYYYCHIIFIMFTIIILISYYTRTTENSRFGPETFLNRIFCSNNMKVSLCNLTLQKPSMSFFPNISTVIFCSNLWNFHTWRKVHCTYSRWGIFSEFFNLPIAEKKLLKFRNRKGIEFAKSYKEFGRTIIFL